MRFLGQALLPPEENWIWPHGVERLPSGNTVLGMLDSAANG